MQKLCKLKTLEQHQCDDIMHVIIDLEWHADRYPDVIDSGLICWHDHSCFGETYRYQHIRYYIVSEDNYDLYTE